MTNKIFTLYVDDTSLRLVVIKGKQIKEWAKLPLESSLVQGNTLIKEAEIAAKIKQLLQAMKVKPKKIMLGVSGLQCLTRPMTLPQLPNVMLDEAVKREAKRVLPVPLEQLYISWQTVPGPEGKIQVFLVAIPCKTVDVLLRALHQAGLEPSFMGIKPLLLARVVKESTAVIVDVQTTEFDIVIMADGVPQPIRTVPFANEALSWQEKFALMRNELDRAITFYNSNNPERPLTSAVPIFVSGELADEPELCQSLSNELGYPVLLLSSPLECLGGIASSRYMANIGLALQTPSSNKDAGSSVVNLNLLPAPYQTKPISLTNILAIPATIVAAGLIVLLVMLIQGTSADIALLRTQLNACAQVTENITELQQKINAVEADRDDFATALGSLEKQSDGINHNLELTVKSLPNAISLTSINHANSILTISGKAPSENEVLLYLEKLYNGGSLGEITTTNMIRTNGKAMDFTLFASTEKQGNGVGGVEIAINSLPSAISLTSANYIDGTLTISGRTSDEDKILSYLRDLEAGGKFSEILITSMTRIEGGEMDFSLVLKVGE
jgi:type IV pilus assembly protein PilM